MSPASSRTMSPGTSSPAGMVATSAARTTRAVGLVISLRAAIARSARYSWTNPMTPLRATIARITAASLTSPMSAVTIAAITRTTIIVFANCAAIRRQVGTRRRSSSSFGPTSASRARASRADRPVAGSVPSVARTSTASMAQGWLGSRQAPDRVASGTAGSRASVVHAPSLGTSRPVVQGPQGTARRARWPDRIRPTRSFGRPAAAVASPEPRRAARIIEVAFDDNDPVKALVLRAEWEPRDAEKELLVPRAGDGGPRIARRGSRAWRRPTITLESRPDPTPRPDEVVIRVRAVGICGSDLHFVERDSDGYMVYPGMVGDAGRDRSRVRRRRRGRRVGRSATSRSATRSAPRRSPGAATASPAAPDGRTTAPGSTSSGSRSTARTPSTSSPGPATAGRSGRCSRPAWRRPARSSSGRSSSRPPSPTSACS